MNSLTPPLKEKLINFPISDLKFWCGIYISIYVYIYLYICKYKKKRLLCCSYNAKKDLGTEHLYVLSKNTDVFTSKYDTLLFLGDFNSSVVDASDKKLF